MKFEFQRNPKLLGVPYERPDNGISHAFIDLKLEPHRIDELPEPRRVAELREILTFLCSTASPFLSLGCEQTYNATRERVGDGQFASYVGVALLGWPFGLEDAGVDVAKEYYDFLAAKGCPDTLAVIVEQQPTVLYHRGVQGWSLDFWLCGYGCSEEEARLAWRAGMTWLREFLEKDARRWTEFLTRYPTRESFDLAQSASDIKSTPAKSGSGEKAV